MEQERCIMSGKSGEGLISVDGACYTDDMKTLLRVLPHMKGTFEIPDSVIHIADEAFANCTGLKRIRIPERVENAWDLCVMNDWASLETIDVDSYNKRLTSVDGVLYSKDMEMLICVPRGRTGSFKIPNGVKRIGERAFWRCVALDKERIT